jgi:secreted trypsin-like serine protease
VVSFGLGCADPDYPGVYTRAEKYRKWILDNAEARFVQHNSASFNDSKTLYSFLVFAFIKLFTGFF